MISRSQQVSWSSNSSPVLELRSKPSLYVTYLALFYRYIMCSNLHPWHKANWVINTTFFYYYYMFTKQLFQDQFQIVNLCISSRVFQWNILQVTTLRQKVEMINFRGRTESLNHSNKWFVLKRLIRARRVNCWFGCANEANKSRYSRVDGCLNIVCLLASFASFTREHHGRGFCQAAPFSLQNVFLFL